MMICMEGVIVFLFLKRFLTKRVWEKAAKMTSYSILLFIAALISRGKIMGAAGFWFSWAHGGVEQGCHSIAKGAEIKNTP